MPTRSGRRGGTTELSVAPGLATCSLCDLGKSLTLSGPQCHRRQNGDQNDTSRTGLREEPLHSVLSTRPGRRKPLRTSRLILSLLITESQGPPDTVVKSVLFPPFADALTRKLKFGRVTALAIPRPRVLSAPNCTCRCEETRNRETYVNSLKPGALSQRSAGPWEQGTDLDSQDKVSLRGEKGMDHRGKKVVKKEPETSQQVEC